MTTDQKVAGLNPAGVTKKANLNRLAFFYLNDFRDKQGMDQARKGSSKKVVKQIIIRLFCFHE